MAINAFLKRIGHVTNILSLELFLGHFVIFGLACCCLVSLKGH